jgi:3-oxoacyl-[acyl-carrier-protein] synthase III
MSAALTIGGWGLAIPKGTLTNADLEASVDTSDEWIVARTGIRERRIAGEGETTATLAIDAGAAAIKHAGIALDEVDLVICATTSPDNPIPATSAIVQDGIGVRCGAFDLNAACAGFVYSLAVAAPMLQTGQFRNVLLVGAETLSRFTDPLDRGTVILFGDGAGAFVLTAPTPGSPGPTADNDVPGILAVDLGCDGSAAEILMVPAGGSRAPASHETIDARDHYMKMEGREVFKRAVRAVEASATAVLERAGVTADDIALFVPHQANVRIIDAAASRLGIPQERWVVNIERYGNTSAASIPIALIEAADAGRIADGDLVLLSGFGAGMTWASAVLRWGRP